MNERALNSQNVLSLALTLATCTNRIERYFPLIIENAAALSAEDTAVCIVDSAQPIDCPAVAQLTRNGIVTIQHGKTLGLSAGRNLALALCRTRHLIFVDDDASITPALIADFRAAFSQGADAVGARLQPAPTLPLNTWFLGYGQYHYLGLHRPDRPASPWGACLGFNVEVARGLGLTFLAELGRTGRQLESGDDTTFLRTLCNNGCHIAVIESTACTHHISEERVRFGYLLRRAMWQGRSEVRRDTVRSGLMKEVRRNFDGVGWNFLGASLGVLYVSAVITGVALETALRLASWRPHRARRA